MRHRKVFAAREKSEDKTAANHQPAAQSSYGTRAELFNEATNAKVWGRCEVPDDPSI